MRTGNPAYAKALDRLRGLTAAPLDAEFQAPLALARSVGLPPTSGYRAVSQMEAAGFLSRDADGTYLRGLDACRVGLSALGAGHFAAICEPVLVRLRQSCRMTAFLGLVDETRLLTGPFSMGRGPDFLTPKPSAALTAAPIWSADGVSTIALTPDSATAARHVAILSRLEQRAGAEAVTIGVFLPRKQATASAEIVTYVTTARRRVLEHR